MYRKWIKRISLSLSIFVIPLLCSCVSVGGDKSGGFDLIKFLQNKYVMMIGVLAIFAWMWSKRGK